MIPFTNSIGAVIAKSGTYLFSAVCPNIISKNFAKIVEYPTTLYVG